MQIRILLLLLFLTTLSTRVIAQGKMLVVETNDGNKQSFVLKEKPQITFDDSQMMVEYSGSVVSYFLTNIKNYHFDNVPASIEKVKGNELRFARVSEDLVRVYSLDVSIKKLIVSDINGKTMSVDFKDGMAEVYLQGLPVGIYIIKVGNQSIKIIKK